MQSLASEVWQPDYGTVGLASQNFTQMINNLQDTYTCLPHARPTMKQRTSRSELMKRLEGLIILFGLVAGVTLVLAAQHKEHGGRPLSSLLSGAAEVPGPGDADGTGAFKVTSNPGQNQICYELAVSNIGTPTAAHIHVGAADKAGPVVVTLKAPVEGPVKDCVELDGEKIKLIIQKPDDYYVNVHNADFPDGAVRGQLSK
jgi:hypothetical protein